MEIYCCTCNQDVKARLTNGVEIYPHRRDLSDLPFWKCDTCSNFVGCHHKTNQRTRPLGVIPSPEIKKKRQFIHSILDPIWKLKIMPRGRVYAKLSKHLGYQYHTAEIRSVQEADLVIDIVNEMRDRLGMDYKDWV